MKTFLVGGAVRDRLLGLPVVERDWVVVGATPDALISQGFKPVGRDFPVFLHPETREEHALARTERKTGSGYRGFSVHASPEVSLEEDLLRRDLTINAMAEDGQGTIIDPYGGLNDLESGVLRHVSPAFGEDPVRVLRVARFAARYAHLGFRIAPETLDLMRDMAEAGEVDALVAERVWAELVKALSERQPSQFFVALRECSALGHLFPELERLFGVPQPPAHHPEVDTGMHTLLVLDQAASLGGDLPARFAALTHDLGKGLTPPELWPRHFGHEKSGLPVLEALCARLKVPRDYQRLAVWVMRYHGHCHRALSLRPGTLVDLLQRLEALKKTCRLDSFLLACEADARGRPGFEQRPYPQAEHIRKARAAALGVKAESLLARGLRGEDLGRELRRMRILAVKAALPAAAAA
jgi:tRNA nucleotidyltransferase (CCA-adding enzyme)